MCTYVSFFPPYFPAHFVGFLLFLPFSLIFSTLSRKWRPTLFALKLRDLLFRISGHTGKEIVKLLTKVWTIYVNKWSKVNTLEDKPRSVKPSFFKCVRNVMEKAVSICRRNNFTRQKGKKKIQLRNIKVSTTVWRYMTNKGWKALKGKRRSTCMVWEGLGNSIAKGDRPANSRDVDPLETIWIIVDEKTYKDPAPKSMD